MNGKTVSATEARIHFGELMRHAVDKAEPVFVERSGRPLVVLLSMEQYQELKGTRQRRSWDDVGERIERTRTRIAAIHGALAQTIDSTLRTLREERHERYSRLR